MEGDVVTLNDIFHFEDRGREPEGGSAAVTVSARPASLPERLVYAGVDRAWAATMEEAAAVSGLPR